jgi:hypothetical protein
MAEQGEGQFEKKHLTAIHFILMEWAVRLSWFVPKYVQQTLNQPKCEGSEDELLKHYPKKSTRCY